MTTRRRINVGPLAVIALGFLVGAAAYPFIPGAAIDHMRGARAQIAFSLPATTLIMYLLFRSLWRHDRVRTGNGAFEATYHAIVFRALLFVLAMHTLLMIGLIDVMDTLGTHHWGKRLVVVMLGMTIIAIGNLLPRTRPNIAFGFRTPLTLSNTQLWKHVHRVGGYATVVLGAAVLVAGLIATNTNGVAALLFPAIGLAVGVVYVSYRRQANALSAHTG